MEFLRPPLLTDQGSSTPKAGSRSPDSTHDLIPGLGTFVWQSNADLSKFFFVSDQAQNILHYPLAQWTTEPGFWAKHINPDRHLQVLHELARAPAHFNRVHFEHTAITPEGATVSLKSSVHLVRSPQGQIQRLHGLSLDLTEYRKSELQLKKTLQENNDIKLALDQTSVVAITDPNGVITYASDLFCKVSGYSREELLGQTHRIVASGEHPKEFYEDLWRIIKRGEIWRGEIKNKAKDGTFNWSLMTIVPFLDPTGKPYQHVSIRTDITAQKAAAEQRIALIRAQEELKRTADAVQIRDEFISAASHELKTPITSLQMKLEIMLREYRRTDRKGIDDARLTKIVESSLQQTRRLTAMIDNMLDVTRIAAEKLKLNLEPVEITALVRALVTQFSEDLKAAKCDPILHVDSPVWGVWDRGRIEQVMSNLMNNAMKYGAGKPIEFKITATSDKARISIQDHGIGIEKDFMNDLFARFERSDTVEKIRGNGLGLWISKKIIEAHKGNIIVESDLGKGSTFIVELPRQFRE